MTRTRLTPLYQALAVIATFSSLPHLAFAAQVPAGTKLHTQQILNRGNAAEPATLDPNLSTGHIESNILYDLFENLMVFDANDNVQPGATASWETKDNKTFIFKLRHNKWSDGTDVTANDFVYSFRRLANPKTGAEYAEYLTQMNLKNAKAIIEGKLKPETLGIRAADSHTLILELESPLSYLPDMLAHPATTPLPQHVVEKYGDQWTKPENIVSNGAFKLQKWVVNERIEMVKNPHYWDAEHVVLNQVNYLPVAVGQTELNRYFSGDLDMIYELAPERFESMQKQYPNELHTSPKSLLYYYLPNLKHPPLDNPKVRKALSLAIDRDVITKKVLGREEVPRYTLMPENISGFTPKQPEWANWTKAERIKEAKRLLEEAGFGENKPLSFTLLYDTKDMHKKMALAVGSMWQKNLNINIKLKNQEWKTYLSDRTQGNFEIVRASWIADYNEASTFLNLLESSNTLNEGHYKNPKYDSLLQASLVETNSEKRTALYQQALEILNQDMPVIPVLQQTVPKLVKSYVGGYVSNAMDVNYSKDLYITAH